MTKRRQSVPLSQTAARLGLGAALWAAGIPERERGGRR